jgi:hypothetical protein
MILSFARAFCLFLRVGHFLSFPPPSVFFLSAAKLHRLGDCLSKQVVLRGAVFSFSKPAGEYHLVIRQYRRIMHRQLSLP